MRQLSPAYEQYLNELTERLHRVVAECVEDGDEAMAGTVRQATEAIITLRGMVLPAPVAEGDEK